MKIEINEISIRQTPDVKFFIRISIGDSMYFDSPPTTLENAHDIKKNLENRFEL